MPSVEAVGSDWIGPAVMDMDEWKFSITLPVLGECKQWAVERFRAEMPIKHAVESVMIFVQLPERETD